CLTAYIPPVGCDYSQSKPANSLTLRVAVKPVPMNKQKTKILILDDDEHVVLTARMILKEHFGQVDTLLSPKTLESVLRKTDYDIILLDMNFKAGLTSGNEGIFWLNRIQSLAPHT